MKTYSRLTQVILLFTGLMFLLPSCEALKDAQEVQVQYDLPQSYFTLDSNSYLKSEHLLFSKSFSANLDSIASANSSSLNSTSFYLLRLSVVSPSGVTLSWLNSARITITPAGGSPIEVATAANISPTASYVDFVIKNIDLASKINGPFNLDLYGDLNGPLPAPVIGMLLDSGLELSISAL